MTGEIPEELVGLPNMTFFDLRDNQLSGELPEELGSLSNLQALYLSGNQLSGCIPEPLSDVEKNDFSDLVLPFCPSTNTPAPSVESDRAALIALYKAAGGANWTRTDNWLSSAPIGEWFGVTTDDTGSYRLVIGGNHLIGEIPAELGSLSNLRVLYLSDNQLRGEIPEELANLSSLESLHLGRQLVFGSAPSST